MHLLSRLSTRLYTLVALFAATLLILIGTDLGTGWQNMRAQRIRQMELMTEAAANLIEAARLQAVAGVITEDAAKARALAAVTSMSYGQGDYFFVRDLAGNALAHPDPKALGRNAMDQADVDGFRYNADVIPRAVRDGAATVEYRITRLGGTDPVRKLSVYRHYKPWGWVVGTGTYTDDLIAAFRSSLMLSAAIAAGLLLLLVGVATWIIRSVIGPTRQLAAGMRDLAAGRMDAPVLDGGALAETRAMAAALGVFRDAALDKARLEVAAAAQRDAAEAGVSSARRRRRSTPLPSSPWCRPWPPACPACPPAT